MWLQACVPQQQEALFWNQGTVTVKPNLVVANVCLNLNLQNVCMGGGSPIWKVQSPPPPPGVLALQVTLEEIIVIAERATGRRSAHTCFSILQLDFPTSLWWSQLEAHIPATFSLSHLSWHLAKSAHAHCFITCSGPSVWEKQTLATWAACLSKHGISAGQVSLELHGRLFPIVAWNYIVALSHCSINPVFSEWS